jgi:hypothetical protein
MATRPTRKQAAKVNWPTKTINVTISIYPRDDEMLQELREHFGTSQSDVVRTGIRTLYVKLLGKHA